MPDLNVIISSGGIYHAYHAARGAAAAGCLRRFIVGIYNPREEGIDPRHLIPLVEKLKSDLMQDKARFVPSDFPLEVRIVTYNSCNGLTGILKTISQSTDNDELRKELAGLIDAVELYRKGYEMEGLKNGDYSEIFPLLAKGSEGKMGRKEVYDKLLSSKYGFYEKKDEIEKMALGCHPNPFNPQTRIDFYLPTDGHAELAVFDVSGRQVAGIEHGTMEAGEHSAEWDGRSDDGSPLASGVYFLRLSTAGDSREVKAVLLK